MTHPKWCAIIVRMKEREYSFDEVAELLFEGNRLLYNEYNGIAYHFLVGDEDGRTVYDISETVDGYKPLAPVSELAEKRYRLYRKEGDGQFATVGVHLQINDRYGNQWADFVVMGALQEL